MNSQAREIVQSAERLGFRLEAEQTGSGHLVLAHPNGARYITAATPSDWRGVKNAVAELERLSGQKLPRANHRRSRKSFAVAPDPEVEASRRRHAQEFEIKAAEREAERAAEVRRQQAARKAAADDRRRREIEELMR